MAELPTEIILYGILTRLPPKDVGRCKSVCSTWYLQLNGEAFVRAHFSRSAIPSNQKVLVIERQSCSSYPIDFETHDYEPGTRITIPFNHLSYDNMSNDISILSHLNGLLFVCHNLSKELFLWNPVTTAFKCFLPPNFNEVYNRMLDSVGLYTDAHGDFKVLYISRRDPAVYVNVYSRSDESWRSIPLILPPECLTTRFHFSSGTLCGGILYFVSNDTVVGGTSFLISFDVNSEEFGMVVLPELPNDRLVHVCLVNAQDQLVMFTATGYQQMQIQMWILQNNRWNHMHLFPLISLDTWCSITHYVTNGRRWFVMAKFEKIFDLHTPFPSLDRLYPVTSWTCSDGALFTETLFSPSIQDM